MILFGAILLLFSNCFKESKKECGINDPNIDSWVCDMESLLDDNFYYELNTNSDDDYLAVESNRIIKVCKNGLFLQSFYKPFSSEDWNSIKLILEDKIYSFSTANDNISPYDPKEKVRLNIYEEDGDLAESLELEALGLIDDIVIENENIFGLLLAEPDKGTLTLKRIHKSDGVLSEFVVTRSGSILHDVYITKVGNYICTHGSNFNGFDNLFYLDNNLNLLWSKSFSDILICDAEFVSNKGIYVAGFDVDRQSGLNFVGLITEDGVIANKRSFVNKDGDSTFRIVDLKVTNKYVFVSETFPESKLVMRISVFNHDLERITSHTLKGRAATSNLVVNENGSISFLYGRKKDAVPHPRIFKLNQSFEIPEMIITQ